MDPYDSDDEPIDFSKCRKKCRKTGLRGLYTEEEVEYLFEEEKPKPLPILPLEIMNKILYEFGGLEHPLTKFYKEVKSSLPAVSKIRTRRNDEEHIWFKKHFNLKNNMYCFNDGDFIEYTKSNLIRVFRGGLVFGFQITPIEQTGVGKTFKRLGDKDNEISFDTTFEKAYDIVRMLDDPSYPSAYLSLKNILIEFSEVNRKNDEFFCRVRISKKGTI